MVPPEIRHESSGLRANGSICIKILLLFHEDPYARCRRRRHTKHRNKVWRQPPQNIDAANKRKKAPNVAPMAIPPVELPVLFELEFEVVGSGKSKSGGSGISGISGKGSGSPPN